jgi:lathosterol oxidase
MLCEIARHGNFFTTWAVLTLLALAATMAMSAWIFRRYYWAPTIETWRKKSSPNYPSPELVRREVLQMLKGLVTATICPALALTLSQHGWGHAYCGVGERGVGWLVISFFAVWLGTDLFEFAYHRVGHVWRFAWKEHRHHHVFNNPSPFAVIADNPIDQLLRSAPMALFPLLMPMNMDLLFFTFSVFFYGYGAYLHWGHELSWPDAHHPVINTAYQHYLHHARSTLHRPYHTGFFFKIWDQLAGSMSPDPCACAKCCVERGERSDAAWAKVVLPDYSVLLRPAFWWSGASSLGAAARADRPQA